MNPEFLPRVFPDTIRDPLGGELTVVLHPTEPRWSLVNDTALEIMDLMDGTRTLDGILAELQDRYPEVDCELLHADLMEVVSSIHACNLIENVPLPPPEPGKSPPPSVTIYLTEECNLRCKHCAIVEGKMPATELERHGVEALIAEHIAKYPNATISFLGGEPTLSPDFPALLEFAASRTPHVTFSTNGHRVTPELAALVARLGVGVQVSLDGADREMHDFIRGKGSFEKAWAAVEQFVAAGAAAKTTVANTLTRGALAQVRQLVERCDRLGLGKLRFLMLNRSGAAITHWEEIAPDPEQLKEVMRWLIFECPARPNAVTTVSAGFPGYVPDAKPGDQHWCPLGRTAIVDSQGRVYTCPSLTTPEVTIGTVKIQSMNEILGGKAALEARQRMLERRHRVPECRACAWRNFCQGGCSAYMAHRSGSMDKNDEFCDFRRDLYREMVRRRAEGL